MTAYVLLVSYSAATLAFLGTGALLLFSRARNPYRHVLLFAVTVSLVWALCFAASPWLPILGSVGEIIEPSRSLAWIAVAVLLLRRLGVAQTDQTIMVTVIVVAGLGGLLVTAYRVSTLFVVLAPEQIFLQSVFALNLIIAVAGVLLTENLFRNADDETRWAIKHLCFGLAALFAYDFFMSAEAALFARLDQNLLAARGLVNALATSLILVSAGRSKDWPIDVHVSRRVVFHTVTLLLGGTYLLVMALAGYAVGSIDATWSGPLQISFFAAAVLILVVVFSSGSARAWLRRAISENFFSYKYDYRDEWLRFIDQVSAVDESTTIAERIVRAMAKLVESTSGALWAYRSDDDAYCPVARWNVSQALPSMQVGASLPRQLSLTAEPLEISDRENTIPEDIRKVNGAWLVVPLMHRNHLLSFLVLGQPRAPRKLDWEDKQLLLTAGSQAASYLAEDILAQDLLMARRFEDLNKRFAFVVHDIKNLTGQMSLLVDNAEKYGNSPEFQKDMLGTVRDGLGRMRKLLVKLKDGPTTLSDGRSLIELSQFLTTLAEEWEKRSRLVSLSCVDVPVRIQGDEDRLMSAIDQLVQNGIEAISGDGHVDVELSVIDGMATIIVSDDGPGMSEQFIEEQLFQPMDSTKTDGYGIGAYQVRETVRDMGGTLEVDSRIGHGTSFRVLFPVATEKAPLKVQHQDA